MVRLLKIFCAFFLGCASVFGAETASGELLKNGDFAAGLKFWRPHAWGENSQVIVEQNDKSKSIVKIKTGDILGKANISQYLNSLDIPEGSSFKLSCSYRTEKMISGKGGYCFLEAKYKGANSGKFSGHQKIVLKPTEDWTHVESIRKFDLPVKNILLLAMTLNSKGQLYLKDISLELLSLENKIKTNEKYVWREAEDVAGDLFVTTWKPKEKEKDAQFFSGRGAVFATGKNFVWNFQIKDNVNPETLFAEKHEYHVWARFYGYLEEPEITTIVDGKKTKTFKTKRTEQADKEGQYIGSGSYYWQNIGSFSSEGGRHSIEIKPSGRCCIDAIIVTTDPIYKPLLFEAKSVSNKDLITDVSPGHIVKACYRQNGVSDKIVSPLSFYLFPEKNKPLTIQKEDEAIKLYLELPENIKIKNIVSHWAGTSWKSSKSPGFLSWKKSGGKKIGDKKYNIYETKLYHLSGRMLAFIKADSVNFIPNRKLSGKCWLEYKGKKQAVSEFAIITVELKPAKAFSKILIGPCGGNTRSFYLEYPHIIETLKFSGINFIDPWHVYRDRYPKKWNILIKQCRKNNVVIVPEHSPFQGSFGSKNKKEFAINIKGTTYVKSPTPHRISLCIPDDSPAMKRNLDQIANLAKCGAAGIALDDEEYNQKKDTLDYSKRVKEEFKKYLNKNSKLEYKDPLEIVKNKKKEKELYSTWVDFKCKMVLRRYKLFRKTFDAAYKQVNKSNSNPLFIAQILKNATPQESKTNTYWDYKKLAEICSHISPMIYTYQGIKDSDRVGDIIKMYHDYIGKPVIAPTLLAGHPGFGEISLSEKKMIYYQILESLMQKASGIFFWYADATLDPLQLQHISSAIRIARPYENFFLKGTLFDSVKTNPDWIRKATLKLNDKVLLYLCNYRNHTKGKIKVTLPVLFKKVLDLQTGKDLNIADKSFEMSFSDNSRGKLFLITL